MSNITNPCRASYTTELLHLPGAHTSVLCSSDKQHGDAGDVQDGENFASLAQWGYPKLGTPGKHPGSTICCNQQHSDTSRHATASPQSGQSPCSSICKPNHNSHVQASRLALVYTICSCALLLCEACIATCSMCQRSMLSLQEIEEQLDPCRATLSD
jgi:hypothetical protein